MPAAFVISTPRSTVGILSGARCGLKFDASDFKTGLLQDRIFETPEAARRAVERLIAPTTADARNPVEVSCRPLF